MTNGAEIPVGARVAVDIGGTFTDVVVADPAAMRVVASKVLSTPHDHAEGVLRGLDGALDIGTAEWFVHGTTVGLNAILSRSGSRIVVVTTAGFRDFLHLGRAERTDIWKLAYRRPQPLIGREDVYEVRERMRADGQTQTPLELDDLDEVVARVQRDGVEAVAVCLINAYVNGAHELQVREHLAARLPGVRIELSHEVAPELREFERGSTTAASAYVAAPVERYLRVLSGRVAERGFDRAPHVMRSNGGTASVDVALEQPVATLLSGPAGGVVGAEKLSVALGMPHLLAIDMGGTSLDASVIYQGAAGRRGELVLDDIPLLLSAVSLATIGAGGGSIARVDHGGLRVGPESAGAAPGPACYGRGGVRPTVTDANVVLGRIGADSLAESNLELNVDRAREAVAGVAQELGLTVEAAAEGIVAVTDAKMADAVRTLTAERGLDPREFALLAFGGAGPLHAAAVAAELGIREVIIPQTPGGFSAWGMLHAPVRHDRVIPFLADAAGLSADRLDEGFAGLRAVCEALLERDGFASGSVRHRPSADMRYSGQEFVVNVPGEFGQSATEWERAFHAEYVRLYAHALPQMPVEFVNLRLSSLAELPALELGSGETARQRDNQPESYRDVVFGGVAHATPVIARDRVRTDPIAGPAIIQEAGSATFAPPGWTVNIGPVGVLELRHGDGA